MPLTRTTRIQSGWPFTRPQSFSPCKIAATASPIQATVYYLYRPVTASPMK